jgi:transposase
MLTVETIRKNRIAIHRDGIPIRKTTKDLNLSRNTVRKVIRSDQTAFKYERRVRPRPQLGDHVDLLNEWLAVDTKLMNWNRKS